MSYKEYDLEEVKLSIDSSFVNFEEFHPPSPENWYSDFITGFCMLISISIIIGLFSGLIYLISKFVIARYIIGGLLGFIIISAFGRNL